jgi:putative ABC transport system substrate-binding protein
MRRLGLAVILALSWTCVSGDAEGQQAQEPKAAKLGFLFGGTSSSPAIAIEPFKQTLRERGWTEGQNLSSLAHPGANLTGVSYFFSEINGKRIELLKEAAPHVARVAVVYNPLNPISDPAVVALETTAKALKMRTQRVAVRTPEDFDAMLPLMTRQTVDAVTVLEDPMMHSQALRIVDVALKNRLPAVFGLSNFAAAGDLMSYGPNRPDLWRKAALLTDKILRGAKPGELPVEQPTKFELVINLKTAKALGLTIPQTLLLRADEIIHP